MSAKHDTETGEITGTMDKDYNLFRYIESCLENALRMETYRRDAERGDDAALAALFTMAQKDNRKGAEIGKKLLASRLPTMLPADGDADRYAEEFAETGAGTTMGTGTSGGTARDTQAQTRTHTYAPIGRRTGRGASAGQKDNPPIDVMAPSQDA